MMVLGCIHHVMFIFLLPFVAALPVVLMPTLAHWEVNIQCRPLLNHPTSIASVCICHTFQQQKLK